MAVTKDLEDARLNLNSSHGKTEKNKKSRPPSVRTSARKRSPGSSQPTESLQVYQSLVTKERWKEIKKMTEIAIKDRKVFMIRGGGFSAIRKALLARGWIQKFDLPRSVIQNSCYLSKDAKEENGNDVDKTVIKYENLIMHKLLEDHPVDFLWTSKREGNDWLLMKSDVILSKFCRANFTSKEGLCSSLDQMYWYSEPGVSTTNFPRCYNLQVNEQMDEFIDNFRLTACMGLLKWLVAIYIAEGQEGVIRENAKIPLTAIDFAIRRLTEYIHFMTHKDIDNPDENTNVIWEFEWDQFLTHHYLVIHENERFNRNKPLNLEDLHFKASKVLKVLRKHWPQIDIDGVMNIWIVKPGNKCRGRGIQLMNNMKEIIAIANVSPATKSRFVVQKYIEAPLIIYGTKFDIRQWFLITAAEPLTIWMYKDSYLRFSSQLYSLSDYHESVHLTNNAVQCKYKNYNERDKSLPDENMWDCHSFKAYLRQIGRSGMWEEKIYSGMKECLIGAMLACQDSLDKRPNSFELYGADFMLTEDFTPWLIEINSSPDLAPTTSVTARMCPQCLEDVIKVVVDTKNDPEADTGLFQLVYKQVIPKAPAYLGLTLSVSGKKILTIKKKNEKDKTRLEREPVAVPSKSELLVERTESRSGTIMQELMTWLLSSNVETVSFKKEPEITSVVQDGAVQDTLKIVKSGLLLKASKAKRRLKMSAKKEKTYKIKSSTYCCKLENGAFVMNQEIKKATKNNKRDDSCQDPKEIKSVGNKRCYIEPTTWEKDTASILRSCLSSSLQESKSENKLYHQITPRVFSPGIMGSNYTCSRLKRYSQKNGSDHELRGNLSLKVVKLKQYQRDSFKKENVMN